MVIGHWEKLPPTGTILFGHGVDTLTAKVGARGRGTLFALMLAQKIEVPRAADQPESHQPTPRVKRWAPGEEEGGKIGAGAVNPAAGQRPAAGGWWLVGCAPEPSPEGTVGQVPKNYGVEALTLLIFPR